VLYASLRMCQRVSAAVLLALNTAAQFMMLTGKQLVQAAAATAQPRPFASVSDCQAGSSDLLCTGCSRGEGD